MPKAKDALERTGWAAERYAAASLDEALGKGTTCVIDNADELEEGEE